MNNRSPLKLWQKFNQEFNSCPHYITFHSNAPYPINLSTNFKFFCHFYYQLIIKKRFEYSDPLLNSDLVTQINAHFHSQPVAKNQIIFTHGSQQALFFSLSVIRKQKNPVLVMEQYNYIGIDGLAQKLNLKIVTLRSYEDIPQSKLEIILKKNKHGIIYVQPDNANPTARSLSLSRRKLLVKLAKKHSLSIVEDLANRPLYYNLNTAPPQLRDLDPQVVSIYSVSKMFFSGLRLGWIEAPPQIIKKIYNIRKITNMSSSPVAMALAYSLLRNTNHLRKITKIYQQKTNFLAKELTNLLGRKISFTQGGYHLWIKLPKKITYQEMHQAKISLIPSKVFNFGNTNPQKNFYRLSVGTLSKQSIQRGVNRLKKIIQP